MKQVYSVIVPTCHRNDLLSICLDRLAPSAQTVATDLYEVIVSDDGSESSAEAMIAAKYPWATWVKGPGRGPAANRNNGARQANGQWLLFTDDDCIPDSSWIEAYANHATDVAKVLEGRTVCRDGLPSLLYESPINERGGLLWSCNFAISQDVFFKIGGFDERFPFASGEDDEFRNQLRLQEVPCLFVPDAVVDHPPRKRPIGHAWKKRWMSQILKETVLDQIIFSDRLMPLRVAVMRMRELRHATSMVQASGMIQSAIVECFDIAIYYRSWKLWADKKQSDGRPMLSSRSDAPSSQMVAKR